MLITKSRLKVFLRKFHLTKFIKLFAAKFYFRIQCWRLLRQISQNKKHKELLPLDISDQYSIKLREIIRRTLGFSKNLTNCSMDELLAEVRFLDLNKNVLSPIFQSLASKRVLFSGQAYYNSWYLSRSLKNLDWKADLLNWDLSPTSQIFYHGQDFLFTPHERYDLLRDFNFYVNAIYEYDIFHFANANGICFGFPLQHLFENNFRRYSEIFLLKDLDKKIVYSNNGCLDGTLQSSFAKWGPESVCQICIWKNVPAVCSDEKNAAWGKFRNQVADYQCLLGGNRTDFNYCSTVHEVPEFYCLETEFWRTNLEIPEIYLIPRKSSKTIHLYHAVGNKKDRTDAKGINIKSSHIYLPLIEKLKSEGYDLELLEPNNLPNKEVRFIQAQADIFLEMLTFGWYGANAREAMMLGKPVICFIRPEWLASVRLEIPEFAEELPIISATPNTIESVLKDLLDNPDKRAEIGKRSREFAIKWHSSEAGGKRFNDIYTKLLLGDPLRLKAYE